MAAATKALAAEVRGGASSALTVIVDAINTKHESQALTLDPRTS